MTRELEAVKMLRERARHASAAVESLLRWSYMIEGRALAEGAGVPLPEDGRAAAANPLRLVKKVASQAADHANPFLIITANEVLHLLDPEAVAVAMDKRREAQKRAARLAAEGDVEQALAVCVKRVGFEEVTKTVLRLEERRRDGIRYLSSLKQAHSAAAEPMGENIVRFPGGAS